MKTTKLLFLIAFFPAVIYAQTNYQQGYIIKNNGDTVKGNINVRDWLYNPQTIDFKADGGANDPVSLSINDIKEFSAGTGITYISYSGYVSKNKNIYPGLDTRLDSTSIANTYFLKKLVSAPSINLYMVNTEGKSAFFYQEKNNQIVELKYYQFYTTSSREQIEKTRPYTYQLMFLAKKHLGESTPSTTAIQRVEYNEKELTKYFEKLANKTPVTTGKNNIQFFTGLGINLNQVSPTVINPPTVTTAFLFSNSVVSSISPKVSLGINIPITPNTNRYIFRSELQFTYLKTGINGQHLTPQGKEIKHTYNLSQYTATLSPQLIINLYNTAKFKYFLGGGVNANFSIYPEQQLVYDDGSVFEGSDFLIRTRTVWLSFPIQTGVVVNNRTEVSAGYWLSSTFTDSRYFSLRNPGFTVGIKYFFKRK